MSDHSGKHRAGDRCFSLVELVVIVTTIVALLSVSLPLFTSSRGQARTTAFMDNLKVLGTNAMMFVEESGRLPAYEEGWVRPLGALSNVQVDQTALPQGIFACPSQEPKSFAPFFTPAEYWAGSHYGINEHIASNAVAADGQPLSHFTVLSRADMKGAHPSEKVLIADASGSNYDLKPDRDTAIAGMSRSGATYADGLPPTPATPLPYLRHDGGSGNFLFLDSSVRTLTSYPKFMLGPGSPGYNFWHGEHWYPGCGRAKPTAAPQITPRTP